VEGSNSWIISGKYTESGEPIIANDPHMSTSIPSSFYQFEGCYYKNNKKICGHLLALPGSMIMNGKFDYMSAVATTIYSDNVDFYQ
jgi:penicillin amidase